MFQRLFAQINADGAGRVERFLRGLVFDQFDRGDQSDAPHLADQRVVGEAPEPVLQPRRDPAHMADDVAFLVDFQGLEGDGGANRVAGAGVAVAEDADLLALLDQGLVYRLGNQHRAEWEIGRGERLGHGHDVRLEVEGLAAPKIAGAPKAADHLVDDEQHVVLLEHRLDLFEIGRRRHEHAARAHDRLGDKGGDRLGAFLEDHLLQILRHAGGERLLAFAGLGEAVVMGAVGVQDVGDRQVEIPVVVRQPGEAGRGHGNPVIGLDAGDDLLLPGPVQGVVVVPHQLDGGVVRLGAGIGEEHLGHRHRRHLDELFGQVDAHVVARVGERVVVGQFAHLGHRGLDQALLVEAERGAPQPGQGLDIGLAVLVIDVNPLTLGNNQRSLLLVDLEVGVGMEIVGDVPCPGRVGSVVHILPLFAALLGLVAVRVLRALSLTQVKETGARTRTNPACGRAKRAVAPAGKGSGLDVEVRETLPAGGRMGFTLMRQCYLIPLYYYYITIILLYYFKI